MNDVSLLSWVSFESMLIMYDVFLTLTESVVLVRVHSYLWSRATDRTPVSLGSNQTLRRGREGEIQ